MSKNQSASKRGNAGNRTQPARRTRGSKAGSKQPGSVKSGFAETAVEHMGYGLSMYDADKRLVLCNGRFREIYGFSEEETKPGTPLADILAQRKRAGLVKVGEDGETSHVESVQEATKKFAESSTYRFPDGRFISIVHQHGPDGAHIVLHQDISEEVALVDALRARERELNKASIRFFAAIDNMPAGLSMYDADQRLVVCNETYRNMYELPDELSVPGTPLSAILEYHSTSGLEPDGRDGSYSDAVTETVRVNTHRIMRIRFPDGRLISVQHTPMSDGGFVATHYDVTEETLKFDALKDREEELAKQNMRFDAAVTSLQQGLSMFDADYKLVVCNEAYAKLYGLPPELATPGTAFEDIISYRIENGVYPSGSAEKFAQNARDLVTGHEMRNQKVLLSDGRTLQVIHVPMPDGGFIGTHQDITEDVEREAELEKQKLRFETAVDNISHGLCMFDSDRRLVICNLAYAEIYSTPLDQLKPGMLFDDIIKARLKAGIVATEDEATYHEELEGNLGSKSIRAKTLNLSNGRILSVLYHPMADGGWVATHQDITAQRRSEEKIRHLARHDPLTDLPNRALFLEEMERAESAAESGEIMAVMCIDLDRFKSINDTLGHSVGDEVLKQFGRRLKSVLRETDMAARLGGDEFAILAGSIETPEDASAIARRIVSEAARPLDIEGHQVVAGATVGIALLPRDGIDTDMLMKNADLALYQAKKEGRGTFHFFEQGMDAALQRRRTIETGLKSAFANQELRLAFQPLLNLEDNRVCCFEALLRWEHSEMGMVPPDAFIPVAEDTGLIVPIGEWVLREACKAASEWPEDIHIAVNLSPVQFKHLTLVDQVASALEESGVDPSRLELEITESLLLHDSSQTLDILFRLRELGVRISMDDFGTGYSSLSYLRAFPFDKIKIDRSFISELDDGEDNLQIIKAVIGLGRSLGMSTTAEGIETESQLSVVREQGCNEVQGFLFSAPLPASGVTALLSARREKDEDSRRRTAS